MSADPSSSSSSASESSSLVRDKLVRTFVSLYDNRLAGEAFSSSSSSPSPPGAAFQKSAIDEVFDAHIQYRDPLTASSGIENYRAQFAALHGTFPTIEMDVLSVTKGKGRGKLRESDVHVPTISAGSSAAAGSKGKGAKQTAAAAAAQQPDVSESDIITIDAVVKYRFNRWLHIPIRQMSILRLSHEGKIVAHEDVWSFADMIENVPVIGWLYRTVQPIAGSLMSKAFVYWYAIRARVSLRSANLSTHTVHAAYHPVESAKEGASKSKQVETAQTGTSATFGKAAMTALQDAYGAAKDRFVGESKSGAAAHGGADESKAGAGAAAGVGGKQRGQSAEKKRQGQGQEHKNSGERKEL